MNAPDKIDDRFEVYRIVTDMEALHEAFIERVEDLQVTRVAIDVACRDFPDLMEPYANRVADELSKDETKNLMRAALRETFNQRWPNRFSKPRTEAAE